MKKYRSCLIQKGVIGLSKILCLKNFIKWKALSKCYNHKEILQPHPLPPDLRTVRSLADMLWILQLCILPRVC